MELRIKIKPVVCQARKKSELFGGRYNGYLNYSSEGYYRYRDGKCCNEKMIFGVNFEKHRQKVKFIKFKSGPKKGRVKETIVVKKAYWTAYVYDFTPYKNIKIKQNSRNFTITQK